jgi:tetratricopeptide (TPR) repeat protein/predicted Ser/Thr protein kinase
MSALPDEPSEPMSLSDTLASGEDDSTFEDGPARVGRYRVLRELGRGGMGVVYAGFDDELSRPVAIKLVLGSGKLGSPARARMSREAQAMAQLSHPNVVQIYDAGEHEGELYLAMELVHGRTLDEWVAELGPAAVRSKRWREIVEVFVAAGRGLAAAHAAGLVHRDFKPGNVLVGEGVVKVGDFGLARGDDELPGATAAVDEQAIAAVRLSERLTETGALVGTPAYLAPEQLASRASSVASDQFSFAVALYEALFDERPFAGDDFASLAANLLAGRRRSVPAGTAVPTWVIVVIERALAREPEQRWPSMDALLAALLDDPARRKRRRLSLGISALVLTLGAGAIGAREVQHRNECEAAGAVIDARWNVESKQQLAEVFAGTDAADAAQTWGRVEPEIDAWTQAWRDARMAACNEARDDPEHARQKAACLEHERWELEALLDVFAEADRTIVIEAVAAVGELPAVERCDDLSWLASDASLRVGDSDEGVGVRRDLARVFALERASRYDDAVTLAQQSVEAARTIGDPVLEAEALAKLGGIRWRMSDFARAEQDLLAGHFLASRVEHDRIAYATARDLSWVVGVRLGRPNEGRVWLEHARAYLVRSGGDPETEPDMFERLGELEDFEGHYAEALAAHERALALREEQLGGEHPVVAESKFAIGRIQAALHDSRALATLERARQRAAATLGSGHPTVAVVDTEIGLLLFNSGRLDESVTSLRRAVEIRERALGPDEPGLATILMNLAAILWEQDNLLESLLLMERAVGILERAFGPEHSDTLSAKNNLAVLMEATGQRDNAIDLLKDVVSIGKRVLTAGDPQLASSVFNLARFQTLRGDHAEALPSWRYLVALNEGRLGLDDLELATNLHDLVQSELAAGETEVALASAQRALAIGRAKLDTDDPRLVDALDDVAIALLALEREGQAVEYHRLARAISAGTDDSRPDELFTLRERLAKLRGVPPEPNSRQSLSDR